MATCSEFCGSGHMVDSSCRVFGVRSYLHHFYQECTASMRDQQENQSQRSSLPWSLNLWKVTLALGALLLTVGLVVMTVGYAIPTRIEAFGEGELLFVDRQAMRYNRSLHVCVLVGTGLLTLGGVLMAGGILMSSMSTPPTPTKQDDSSPQSSRGESKMGCRILSAMKSPADPVTKPPSPALSDGGISPLARDDKVQKSL
ncbi:neurensin 1-like [Triplophysa dalaica]|uniref:neurensin 1-like n=1 Tax=Triplophysa dalaica TaxID=1582913 RepID=UPI0024E011B8|nr:neurensin 1-like [Triplophysa dalaica]